jgi:hypothetical protein
MKNLAEKREKESLLARTAAAELSSERLMMQNEDLVSCTVRGEYELSKLRCYDLQLENKLDDALLETDSLRTMHAKAVSELEQLRSDKTALQARLQAVSCVMEKNTERKSGVDRDLVEKQDELDVAQLELTRAKAVMKKQHAALEEERKKSSL